MDAQARGPNDGRTRGEGRSGPSRYGPYGHRGPQARGVPFLVPGPATGGARGSLSGPPPIPLSGHVLPGGPGAVYRPVPTVVPGQGQGPGQGPGPAPVINREANLHESLDELITALEPCRQSEERRIAIFQFVRSIIEQHLPYMECYLMGSFPLKAYLPDSDLDMTVCVRPGGRHPQVPTSECNADDDTLVLVNRVLCKAAVARSGSKVEGMEIRNISFVNARTKVVNCVVQNVSVDITVNQGGSLASLTLLEEVDRQIGRDHLFKRSLLLIKAWCLHEAHKYAGVSVLGSKAHGGLSSFALSVMIVALFNESGFNLRSPFHVFVKFLQVYSVFDWSYYVLTIEGPFPKNVAMAQPGQFFTVPSTSPSSSGRSTPTTPVLRFAELVQQLREQFKLCRPVDSATLEFPFRVCNIQDPLNPWNNLGYSLNRQSLLLLQHALTEGRRHLEHFLAWSVSLSLDFPPAGAEADEPPLPPWANVRVGSSSPAAGPPPHWPSPSPPPRSPPSTCPVAAPSSSSSPPAPKLATVFFPRLCALYADPKVRRSDLLDHPCEARTEILVCDESSSLVQGTQRSSRASYDPLMGDRESFWRALRRVHDLQQQQLVWKVGQGDSQAQAHEASQREGEGEEEETTEIRPEATQPQPPAPQPQRPQQQERQQRSGSLESLPMTPPMGATCSRCVSPGNLDLSLSPRHQPDGGKAAISTKSGSSSCGGSCSCSHETALVTFTSCSTSSVPSSPSSVSSLSSESPPPRDSAVKQKSKRNKAHEQDDDEEEEEDDVRRVSHTGEVANQVGEEQEEGEVEDELAQWRVPPSESKDWRPPALSVLEEGDEDDATASAAATVAVEVEGESAASVEEAPALPSVEGQQPCSPVVSDRDTTPEPEREETPEPELSPSHVMSDDPISSRGNEAICQESQQDAVESSFSVGEQRQIQAKGIEDIEGEGGPTERGAHGRVRDAEEREEDAEVTPRAVGKKKKNAAAAPSPSNRERDRSAQCSSQRAARDRKGKDQARRKRKTVGDGQGSGQTASSMRCRDKGVQTDDSCPAVAAATAATSAALPWWGGTPSPGAALKMAILGVIVGLLCATAGWKLGASRVAMDSSSTHASEARQNTSTAVEAALGVPPPISRGVGGQTEQERKPRPSQPAAPIVLTHWLPLGTTFNLGGAGEGPHGRTLGKFVWLKDGVRLETAGDGSLAITSAGIADEGEYALYRSRPVARAGGRGSRDTNPQDQEQGAENEDMVLLGVTRVRVSQPPVLAEKPPCKITLKQGDMLAVTLRATGLPPPSYQWRLNGVPLPRATRNAFIVPSVNASHAGTYTCEVRNIAGTVTWEEAVVEVIRTD